MKPWVIAHRGARGLVPFENTMEAFEKAVEVGADMVECDVHRTCDGHLVILHDDALPDGRAVASLTLAELRAWTHTQGFEAPTLPQLIDQLAGRIRFDIEVKATGFEAEVVALVTARLRYDEFVLKSFHDAFVREVKMLDPQVVTGLLMGDSDPPDLIRTRLGEFFPGRRARACRADFVSPNVGLVRLGYVERAHRQGWPVYVWTVNDVKTMEHLCRIQVDAIITDRPDLALGARQRVGAW